MKKLIVIVVLLILGFVAYFYREEIDWQFYKWNCEREGGKVVMVSRVGTKVGVVCRVWRIEITDPNGIKHFL